MGYYSNLFKFSNREISDILVKLDNKLYHDVNSSKSKSVIGYAHFIFGETERGILRFAIRSEIWDSMSKLNKNGDC